MSDKLHRYHGRDRHSRSRTCPMGRKILLLILTIKNVIFTSPNEKKNTTVAAGKNIPIYDINTKVIIKITIVSRRVIGALQYRNQSSAKTFIFLFIFMTYKNNLNDVP